MQRCVFSRWLSRTRMKSAVTHGACARPSEGLRLMTGRLLACEIARSKMRVSVIGPIGDDVRSALGAEAEKDEEFKKVLADCYSRSPSSMRRKLVDLLKDGLNSFVDLAMARVRSSVSLEDHVPKRSSTSLASSAASCRNQSRWLRPDIPNELDDASDEDDVGVSRRAQGSRAGADLRARSALHCFADE